MTRSRRIGWMTLALLTFAAIIIHQSATIPLSPSEAQLSAITHDAVQVREDGLRAYAGGLVDSVQAAINEASALNWHVLIPLIAIIDVQEYILGESELILRLALIQIMLVLFAWVLRFTLRRTTVLRRLVLVLFAIVAVAIFSPTPYDWRGVLCDVSTKRQPLDASISVLADEHPATYYARQCGATLGLHITLALEGDMNDAEALVARFADVPTIWLFLTEAHPISDKLRADAEAQGRTRLNVTRQEGVTIESWVQSSS